MSLTGPAREPIEVQPLERPRPSERTSPAPAPDEAPRPAEKAEDPA